MKCQIYIITVYEWMDFVFCVKSHLCSLVSVLIFSHTLSLFFSRSLITLTGFYGSNNAFIWIEELLLMATTILIYIFLVVCSFILLCHQSISLRSEKKDKLKLCLQPPEHPWLLSLNWKNRRWKQRECEFSCRTSVVKKCWQKIGMHAPNICVGK